MTMACQSYRYEEIGRWRRENKRMMIATVRLWAYDREMPVTSLDCLRLLKTVVRRNADSAQKPTDQERGEQIVPLQQPFPRLFWL